MKSRPGQPRGLTRLARALGLDRNPLRRATDRAEAWIRVGLLAVFLIAGPMAALGAGLPDCAGVALGFDRLVALALGAERLSQAMAFPIDRA